MRNIIYISLISVLVAGAAMAQTPVQGCFIRDYSDAHLAQNPNQVVQHLSILFWHDDQYDDNLATVRAVMADQGHAGAAGFGGKILDQVAYCHDYGGQMSCGVECDGGSFDITMSGSDQMDISTQYFTIGDSDSCGGPSDLAEIREESTIYRLFRADLADCEAN